MEGSSLLIILLSLGAALLAGLIFYSVRTFLLSLGAGAALLLIRYLTLLRGRDWSAPLRSLGSRLADIWSQILGAPFRPEDSLLLLCLLSGVLKAEHIQEKSDFLLANMAFFFIPAGVNVINYLDILRASWLPLLVICLVTMVITFAATALSIRLTVQLLHKKEGGRKHE